MAREERNALASGYRPGRGGGGAGTLSGCRPGGLRLCPQSSNSDRARVPVPAVVGLMPAEVALRARADPVRLFGAAGAIDGALLRPFGSGPPIQFHGEHLHVPPFRRGAAARVQRVFVVAKPDRAFK